MRIMGLELWAVNCLGAILPLKNETPKNFNVNTEIVLGSQFEDMTKCL